MNAEFQGLARRDKKVSFSDQCKETEGKNRMGKTRDLLKKIRDTKEFSCKDGHNKEQKHNGPNRSKKYYDRGGKNTQKSYSIQKRSFNPDDHDDVVTHLEPHILECEVK